MMKRAGYRAALASITCLIAGLTAQSAYAEEQGAAQAPQIAKLQRCGEQTSDESRLACYDAAVHDLIAATAAREIIIVERATAAAARKRLFGLQLPKLHLFGGDEEEINKLEGVVDRVGRDQDNRLTFALKDGARWRQTDDRFVSSRLGEGTTVVIERGAFGSYFATFAKMGSVRVRREN